MTDRTTVHGLQVANELYEFVNQEVLPEVGLKPDADQTPARAARRLASTLL